MAWEVRGNAAYFYQSVRVEGRPRKVYLGRRPEAEAEARQLEEQRRQRLARRESTLAEAARRAPAEEALERFWQELQAVAGATLVASGYRRHKGEWRRRRYPMAVEQAEMDVAEAADGRACQSPGKPGEPPARGVGAERPRPAGGSPSQRRPAWGRPAPPAAGPGGPPAPEGPQAGEQPPTSPPALSSGEWLQALSARAEAGDAAALRELRRFLDDNPEVWGRLGDAGRLAVAGWAELLADGNPLLAEALKRSQERMAAELAGPGATPLESLLARHAGVTHLAAVQADHPPVQASRERHASAPDGRANPGPGPLHPPAGQAGGAQSRPFGRHGGGGSPPGPTEGWGRPGRCGPAAASPRGDCVIRLALRWGETLATAVPAGPVPVTSGARDQSPASHPVSAAR
jgi:hypothetical protein